MQQVLQGMAIGVFIAQITCLILGIFFKNAGRKDLLLISAILGPIVILITVVSLLFQASPNL